MSILTIYRNLEKLNFGYSLKNIRTSDEKSYKLCLLENINKFITYGLKSGKSPMQVKDLIQFQDVLVRMVKELKVSIVKNNFQIKLREDMKQVQT